jgi:putative FmdB family regulatory protein
MPVYEFVCRDCQKPFEVVRPMSESTTTPKCPACGSTHVDRTYSHVYAQTSKRVDKHHGACGPNTPDVRRSSRGGDAVLRIWIRQPFMQITGSSRATARDRPARSAVSTTALTSL